jgi:SAM-dependent methyltransferase
MRADTPKPAGWALRYGASFDERSAAARYHLRPPYPRETFELLATLVPVHSRAILDAGCGLGDLARPLAPLVDTVDAVDRSAAMLEAARRMPGADAANLRWIEGEIEEVELAPPYGLVVCGDSIHWFDWNRVIERFARLLPPDGLLVIVQREWLTEEHLRERLRPIYSRHSANPEFDPRDPVHELERRGLFDPIGRHVSAPHPWRPTLDELIGCHHSQSGFVLERMADPEGFDRDLTEAAAEFPIGEDGRFLLSVTADLTWGRPVPVGQATTR